MTKDETLKIALEALENHEGNYKLGRAGCERQEAAITAIKEALAQPPLPVQEPVVFYRCKGCSHAYGGEAPSSCDCMDDTGFERVEYFTTPPLPVQPEPVTWDKPSASFNDWWDSDRRRDNANPFTTDSFSYWAYEGWQAALAQRQWVGLTEEEIKNLELTSATSSDVRNISAELKDKNT